MIARNDSRLRILNIKIKILVYMFLPIIFILIGSSTILALDHDLNIFSYTSGDIRRLVKKIRFDLNYPSSISRNSQGTEIRIHFTKYIFVISKDGKINCLEKPSTYAWLNDEHSFVAWYSAEKLTFMNGTILSAIVHVPIFDLNAKYFSQTNDGKVSLIYSTNVPNKLLAKVDAPYAKIFEGIKTVYIIGADISNNNRNLLLYIFKKGSNHLDLQKIITINRPSGKYSPFYVTDMDTNKGIIAIADQYDMPFSFLSPLYLYDISTSSLKRIRRAKEFNLFLEDDIVANFIKKK